MNCMNGKLMYCITYEHVDVFFLGWQKPSWDESGYFWTRIDTFKQVLHNNTPKHPFLVDSREEAIKHLTTLDIKQICRITPIRLPGSADDANDNIIYNGFTYPGISIEAANSIWGCGR